MKILSLFVMVIFLMTPSCKKKETTKSIPSDIYGTYRGDAICGGSHGDNFGDVINISERSSETVWLGIQINAVSGYTLIMKVDGNSLTIDSQTVSNVTYSGSGTYSSGHIFMDINTTYQGGAYSCHYAHSK
jgi:hypothetical protein